MRSSCSTSSTESTTMSRHMSDERTAYLLRGVLHGLVQSDPDPKRNIGWEVYGEGVAKDVVRLIDRRLLHFDEKTKKPWDEWLPTVTAAGLKWLEEHNA